jgi:ribulose-phosphate 3-epimerase
MCADFGNLEQEIKALDKAGADIFHMDIMDGEFVPNFALSWHDFGVVRNLTDKPLDAHLMVKDPSIHLPYAYKYGADIVYVHYESQNAEKYLEDIKAHGKQAGLVVNPNTKLDDFAHLLSDLDKLLIMRVNPGFAGQTAIPEVEFKIHQLSQLKDRHFSIALDGHVSPETIRHWNKKGVEEFVCGTASGLFGKNRNGRSYEVIFNELRDRHTQVLPMLNNQFERCL